MSKFRDSTIGSVVVLALVCLVVTAALAGAYQVTKDPIEKAEAAAIAESLGVVLPTSTGFEEIEIDELPDGITSAYKSTNDAGYVFLTDTKGYGGSVITIVGMDPDGNYTGIEITKHQETPGIGTKVIDPEYLSQYYGQNQPRGVDAVAGSTRTSNALQGGLEIATHAHAVVTGSAPPAGSHGADEVTMAVLPGADTFTPIDVEASNFPPEIEHAYSADNGAGYVFITSTEGFGGKVTYEIGIDKEGKIAGILVVSHQETEDYGTKVLNEEFLAQYQGKTDAKDVDMVANATITNKSLRKAIRITLEAYATLS